MIVFPKTERGFFMPTTAIREAIDGKIFHFRGHKVMADRDLAQLYGVPTKALNQAVKRNKRRFPADFMFTLSKKEAAQLVTNCDRFNSSNNSTTNTFSLKCLRHLYSWYHNL